MYVLIDSAYYLGDGDLRKVLNISGENNPGYTEITQNQLPGDFVSKNDIVYSISTDTFLYKTDVQKKTEKLTSVQSSLLTMLMPINVAIASQTGANIEKVKNGRPEVYTISGEDIEEFGDYQNKVSTFHETWDPNIYTIDQINIGIFNGGVPDLPDFIKRLLNGG